VSFRRWHRFLSSCWAAQESERPSIEEVVRSLGPLRRDLWRGQTIAEGAGLPVIWWVDVVAVYQQLPVVLTPTATQ
jgi:hypothetical protein